MLNRFYFIAKQDDIKATPKLAGRIVSNWPRRIIFAVCIAMVKKNAKHNKSKGLDRWSFLIYPMPKVKLVERGKEYLYNIPLEVLDKTHRRKKAGKSRDRLQTAVLRKCGHTLDDISKIMGRNISTVHRRLFRLNGTDLEHRHDKKSPNRPRNLTPEQEHMIENDLDKPQNESGFSRYIWNSKMIQPDAYTTGSALHVSKERL